MTSAPLGPQGLVLLVPLETKDKQAFPEAPGPLACQAQRVKQDELSPYLARLGQKDCQGPRVSKAPKATGASQEPQDGQASPERRAPWASPGLGFQGLRAPRVRPAYLETWDLLGVQVARDLTAHLAAQVCQAKRESLALVCQDSRDFLVFPAFPARLERRGASGDPAFQESMEPSAPLGFRASEATRDLLEYKAPWDLREPQE